MIDSAPILGFLDGRGLLATLLIGGIAGWLAGQITRRRGFGVLRNILIGILGSVLGGWFFGLLGLAAYGLVGQIVMATVGALLLLYLVNVLTQRR